MADHEWKHAAAVQTLFVEWCVFDQIILLNDELWLSEIESIYFRMAFFCFVSEIESEKYVLHTKISCLNYFSVQFSKSQPRFQLICSPVSMQQFIAIYRIEFN